MSKGPPHVIIKLAAKIKRERGQRPTRYKDVVVALWREVRTIKELQVVALCCCKQLQRVVCQLVLLADDSADAVERLISHVAKVRHAVNVLHHKPHAQVLQGEERPATKLVQQRTRCSALRLVVVVVVVVVVVCLR